MSTDKKSQQSVDRRPAPDDEKLDLRKQLFNEGAIGPIKEIQLPMEMITRLHGIMLDIDPILFRDESVPAGTKDDPDRLYEHVVWPWMERHPVLIDAQVRISGRGLHLILRFTEPVEFTNEGDRQRWAGIVKAIQAILPTDPDAPGITATTRALGSINSKNGAVVKQIFGGNPIPPTAVLQLFDQLREKPFRTIMNILLGAEKVSPCPICHEDNSSLSALDRVGKCYGKCGRVKLPALYDVFLKPRPAAKK